MQVKDKTQTGFTIIELMIATVVFTIIMLIITISVMHFTNSYYKGLTQSSTQTVARNIVNSVTQAIQFTGDRLISSLPQKIKPGSTGAYCIGGELYSFKLGVEQEPSSRPYNHQNVLVVRPDPNCSTTSITPNLVTGGNAQGLLSSNMWLASFSIDPIMSTTLPASPPVRTSDPIIKSSVVATLYRVHVRVLYGASSLLTTTLGDNSFCGATIANHFSTTGSQFCATSGLSSIVEARIQ